jgi:hypothetical protein
MPKVRYALCAFAVGIKTTLTPTNKVPMDNFPIGFVLLIFFTVFIPIRLFTSVFEARLASSLMNNRNDQIEISRVNMVLHILILTPHTRYKTSIMGLIGRMCLLFSDRHHRHVHANSPRHTRVDHNILHHSHKLANKHIQLGIYQVTPK